MKPADPDRPELTPEDERLVRLVGEASRPPLLGPAERLAFHAELERRLARVRQRSLRAAAAGAAAAAAVALLVFSAGEEPATRPSAASPEDASLPARTLSAADEAAGVTAEEALLALESESAGLREASLPEDYAAIESLLLGG